jgi:hypothetical protein
MSPKKETTNAPLHELGGNPANSDVAKHLVLEPARYFASESEPEEADQSNHGIPSFRPSQEPD